MSRPTLEFWYEFSSPYCYLTAKRLAELANERNVDVVWKPFLLGSIFKSQGREAPVTVPAKANYMWRDLERKSQKRGYPYRKPEGFPTFALMSARIGIVASGEPWEADFVKGIFELYFEQGQDISGTSPEAIFELLHRLELNVDDILARTAADEFKDKLRENTEAALALGIFGAPMFFAKGEMFWGDESLEDAIDFLLEA